MEKKKDELNDILDRITRTLKAGSSKAALQRKSGMLYDRIEIDVFDSRVTLTVTPFKYRANVATKQSLLDDEYSLDVELIKKYSSINRFIYIVNELVMAEYHFNK